MNTANRSSSSFYLNQATRPININKRLTDRQIDSISKRKKKCNVMYVINVHIMFSTSEVTILQRHTYVIIIIIIQ